MARALVLAIACSACVPSAEGAAKPDYAEHIKALKKKLGDSLGDISVRVEEPFVVIGDAGDDALARDAKTVRWAADRLEHDFFQTRPKKILDIYLFHDARSYERGVKLLTTDAPDTPYGFYSHATGGLYMNIATGGGTLVHEIVHPYVEADFPGAPAWLNEGLGSMFEQSAEKEGHIVGLTNWRLAGLQKALAHGHAPSFDALAHMSDTDFYNDDSGTHYATARYLLYYLQQQGLLRDFYRAFRAARAKDPSGYATLVATLGSPDMNDFRATWEKFVVGLRFR
jgi:hypothetical protein